MYLFLFFFNVFNFSINFLPSINNYTSCIIDSLESIRLRIITRIYRFTNKFNFWLILINGKTGIPLCPSPIPSPWLIWKFKLGVYPCFTTICRNINSVNSFSTTSNSISIYVYISPSLAKTALLFKIKEDVTGSSWILTEVE